MPNSFRTTEFDWARPPASPTKHRPHAPFSAMLFPMIVGVRPPATVMPPMALPVTPEFTIRLAPTGATSAGRSPVVPSSFTTPSLNKMPLPPPVSSSPRPPLTITSSMSMGAPNARMTEELDSPTCCTVRSRKVNFPSPNTAIAASAAVDWMIVLATSSPTIVRSRWISRLVSNA